MTLPPELYNLVLRSKRIEVCPNCQCILVPSEKAESKKEQPAVPLEPAEHEEPEESEESEE
jgi:hypothetical protein